MKSQSSRPIRNRNSYIWLSFLAFLFIHKLQYKISELSIETDAVACTGGLVYYPYIQTYV